MPAGLRRTRYRQETALLDTPAKRRWFILLLAVVVALPELADRALIDVLNSAAIAALVAIPLNLLTGIAGQISLGPAALLAVGAYTAGVLSHEAGLSLLAALPAAALAGALVGVLVGLPSLRLKGLYLVLATLALHFIVVTAGAEYQFVARLNTGVALPAPTFGGYRLSSTAHWYYLLTAMVMLYGLLAANLRRSRTGRAWMAIRDRDLAAASLGVNLARYKLTAFTATSAMGAVAGVFHGYYVGVVTVEAFSLFLAIQFVAMIIIGGLGSVAGSVLGALFVTLVLEFTETAVRALPLPALLEANPFALNSVIFGLLMILFLLLEPRGLVAIWGRVQDWLLLWPFRFRPLRG